MLRLVFLSIISLSVAACQVRNTTAQPETISRDTVYTYSQASSGGTGKVYMGRQIAHVMGHQGASWLDRPEREREEGTQLVLANLNLKETDVVADIGAGSGYYSFKIASRLSKGKVIAVDIQQEMLEIIEKKQKESGIENIDRVLCSEQNPNLSPNSIDIAMFVDVYHELSYPREVMENLKTALKPEGKVILLEFRLEDPEVPIKLEHKMSEAQVRRELEAIGYRFVENKNILPWQHFLIFEK